MFLQVLEWLYLILPTYEIIRGEYNPWLFVPFYMGFLILKLLRRYDRDTKRIPEFVYASVLALLILGIVGESYLGLYYHILHYDKVLHFIYGVVSVLIVYYAFVRNSMHWAYTSLFASLVGHSIWEYFEYLVDKISGTTVMRGVFINLQFVQGAFEDTWQDLIIGAIGALLVIIVLALVRIYKKRTREAAQIGSSV